ncbi:aquaporin family protein [Ramlibacter ginsenosidimutans]|uniref:Aquaporin family protein n=1 Tax=Ramlibacter ginsenosidimutans TaxID=502333 RepID=A0A934TQ82_9BURK|nr:MIP/aquaporin family protein [Ramlibacter ginsenosidimutans]MBK6005474.1 aquaporin family protein [Ramlibacter ginsenosidimutans]
MKHRLRAAVLAEFVGTAMLLCAVIGSGIMAERLSGGNSGLALLANTLATVFALLVLIETLWSVSGAHFNPAVTLVLAARGLFRPEGGRRGILLYIVAQVLGGVAGAWLANAMFDLSVIEFSSKVRSGWGPWLGEVVATAGLLFVVLQAPAGRGSFLVAAYIGAAYWFTSSTSFANPAAVIGRMFSDSFAGIAPASAAAFIAAELVGAGLGTALAMLLRSPE